MKSVISTKQKNATYLHDHKNVLICLNDVVELAHMLVSEIFHGIYFTLHSWKV